MVGFHFGLTALSGNDIGPIIEIRLHIVKVLVEFDVLRRAKV